MEVKMHCIKSGEESYNYYRVDDDAADEFYSQLKYFWSNRPHEDVIAQRKTVESYRSSNSRQVMEALQSKVLELYSARIQDTPFSMIDLGGASGSIFHFMKKHFPTETLNYLLIEPFAPFVEDFLQNHPDQKAITADAESFANFGDEIFEDAPYNVFFASGVFCMIKPKIVMDVLTKVSSLTDDIIVWDVLENLRGELDPVDPVMFDYFPEGLQWYFAHNFAGYLADLGFEIVSEAPTPTDTRGIKGWAVFHATRQRRESPPSAGHDHPPDGNGP